MFFRNSIIFPNHLLENCKLNESIAILIVVVDSFNQLTTISFQQIIQGKGKVKDATTF